MTARVKRRSPAEEAWRLMGELWEPWRRAVYAIAAEFDLSPPQLFALKHLDPDHPLPMRELASALACDSSNVTGIIDRLEQRGLVERRPAPRDRRIKHLVLTDDGLALRARLLARMDEPPPALAALPAEDQRALRDILRRAVDGGS